MQAHDVLTPSLFLSSLHPQPQVERSTGGTAAVRVSLPKALVVTVELLWKYPWTTTPLPPGSPFFMVTAPGTPYLMLSLRLKSQLQPLHDFLEKCI